MGRAKLNMELITKEKSRNITFKKRKEGLVKKTSELAILCDKEICLIMYGPRQEKGSSEPEIWPQNVEVIRRMIDIYRGKNKDSIKSYGLSDFFHDRARKIEDEHSKLRKKNMEAKYPTWPDLLNGFNEVQLREFAANLRVKFEDIRSRVDNMKKSKEINLDANYFNFGRINSFQNQSFYNPTLMMQRGNIEFEVLNQQAISSIMQYPNLDHNQEFHQVSQNSMMMPMLSDGDHCMQFGGLSTSSNVSFKHPGFYEPSALDPTMCYTSPRSLPRFYAPLVAPTQYMMSRVLPEQFPAAIPTLPQLPSFPKESSGGSCNM